MDIGPQLTAPDVRVRPPELPVLSELTWLPDRVVITKVPSRASGLGEPHAANPAPSSAMEPARAAFPPGRARLRFLVVVAALTLAADVLTKLAAVRALTRDKIDLVQGNLDLVLRRNQGGAWSMLHDAPEWIRRPFFVAVSVAAIVFVILAYRRVAATEVAGRWGFALVLGGALGNLVDRIRDSSVVDFIHAHATWGGAEHDWPTFNVADVAICAGVALLMLATLRGRRSIPARP